TARVPVLELDDDDAAITAALTMEERIPTIPAADAAKAAPASDAVISAEEIDDILEFDLPEAPAAATADVVKATIVLDPAEEEATAAAVHRDLLDLHFH